MRAPLLPAATGAPAPTRACVFFSNIFWEDIGVAAGAPNEGTAPPGGHRRPLGHAHFFQCFFWRTWDLQQEPPMRAPLLPAATGAH